MALTSSNCYRKIILNFNLKWSSSIFADAVSASTPLLYHFTANYILPLVNNRIVDHLEKCDQESDVWQQLELASELETDLRDTVDWGKKWLVDFNWFRLTGLITVIQLMWKWTGLRLRKNRLLRWWGWPSLLKLDCGSYIFSIAKIASQKIGVLVRSMKFLSPEVVLYLYKSTIRPCMEYCCHVWAGAPVATWNC